MFGKLAEAQKKAAEIKERLENISVTGEAEGGKIQVVVSGSRKVRDIKIHEDLMADREELQDLLQVALNRALEQADKVSEAEMQSVVGELMPGGLGMLGGLFGKK